MCCEGKCNLSSGFNPPSRSSTTYRISAWCRLEVDHARLWNCRILEIQVLLCIARPGVDRIPRPLQVILGFISPQVRNPPCPPSATHPWTASHSTAQDSIRWIAPRGRVDRARPDRSSRSWPLGRSAPVHFAGPGYAPSCPQLAPTSAAQVVKGTERKHH